MATTRVTHFMGNPHVQNTACGKFVSVGGSTVRWSSSVEDVTCRKCLALVGKA